VSDDPVREPALVVEPGTWGSLVLALIGHYSAVPYRASTMLGSLQTWMGKNDRAITVVVCPVFGAFFLVRGFLGA